LKKLYKENLKEDAKLGWKKAEKEIHSKKETLKKQAEELQREYEEIQGMSDDSIQKQLKLSEIEAKYRKIIAEWNETTDFEAEIPSLSWWKKDKSPEQTPIPDGMPQTNNIA
jgi:DNA repair exonuclease SbcCD ATPase subunit